MPSPSTLADQGRCRLWSPVYCISLENNKSAAKKSATHKDLKLGTEDTKITVCK